ncbi:MAG: hypothetical protein IPM97_08405 [Bdellovibrionaceae bacterium]|nr:hypothetical protein [Pseudobdellovibrionaceae bacterium]
MNRRHRFFSTVLSRRWILGFATLTILIPAFQNCSSRNFETINGGADLASESISYSAPASSLASAVPALSSSRTFNLKFNINIDPKLSLKSATCHLGNLPSVDCRSGTASYTDLTDGDYVLTINIEDSANQRGEPLIAQFRIDGTKPVVAVSQTPAAISGATSTSFTFVATDGLSGVTGTECAIDGGVYSACTSPMNVSALSQGTHAIKIRALDRAMNMSDEYSFTWKVDTTAPSLNLLTTPAALTKNTSPDFSFNGMDDGQVITQFECQLDNGVFSACVSPKSYAGLTEGKHSFFIRGRDTAGNLSQSVSYSWSIDLTPPAAPVISTSITNPSRLTQASFQFNSTDAGSQIASYSCALDSGAFATCSSPKSLSALTDGMHVLKVKSTDNAGNESAVASFSWLVDITPPVLSLMQAPATSTTETSASFVFSASDTSSGVASLQCQLDSSAYSTCTSPQNFTGLAPGTHSLRILAIDKATNQTTVSHTWSITTAPMPTATPTPVVVPPTVIGGEVPVTASSIPTVTYRMAKEPNDGHNGGVSWESVFLLNNGTIASFGTGNHLPEQSNAMNIIDPVSTPGSVKVSVAFPWTQSNSPRDQYNGRNLYVSNYDNHPTIYIPSENKAVWAGHGVFDFNVNQWTYGDRAPLTKTWSQFVKDANPSQETAFNPSVGWCKDLDKGVWFGNSGGGYGRSVNDLTLIERTPSGSATPWKLSVYNMGSQGISGIDRSRNSSVCIGEYFYLGARVSEGSTTTIFYKIHIPTMKVTAKLQPIPTSGWGYFPQLVHDTKRNRLVFLGSKIMIYSLSTDTWSDVTPSGWVNYEHINGVYQPTVDAIFFRGIPVNSNDTLTTGFEWHRIKFND